MTPLNTATIEKELKKHAIVFDSLLVHNSIPSTNEAMKTAGAGIHICLAEAQTAGRAQGNKSWHSPAFQNIYLSIKMPLKTLKHVTRLPILVALNVLESLKPLELPIMIKWPNDLYVNDKKLAGILVETITQGEQTQAIIGIGLNVNMRNTDTLSNPWTSLAELSGETFNRSMIAIKLIPALLNAARDFSHTDDLNERFLPYDYLKEKSVVLEGSDQAHPTQGIDNEGGLRIKTSEGIKTLTQANIKKIMNTNHMARARAALPTSND
ncbi:MAG: biotin--[acetyl-CoA-carboxylase] ligase [Gammaproteobacteria bacterium CG11_big_fil_rev_8_21_14_0_20_46_22]|nr:MAG: biotin--[acetyl-CoA-carboxylase] ligase [Gammaproteobacteria bacterium CG12_big_fil_rev_8_21_14_0_65_46_12]PIR10317.1 MAG: biotin--[acetyl-CoA-carboxylase] ligase [Gammaproteobacteria bacterium CG11_big_fil_rev_8_21_14_0_20_46_22]